jgi:hypothetical protein
MQKLMHLLLTALLAVSAAAADKPRITSQDQLPRFNYTLAGKVTDIVTDEAAYARLAPQVRANLEKLLADYDIADRTTLQDILGTLMSMDVHEGRYDQVLTRVAQMRALEEKPAAKLMLGLLAETYAETRKAGDFSSEEAFRAALAKAYANYAASGITNVMPTAGLCRVEALSLYEIEETKAA